MIYKISGVWGNHEGSLLLWVLILALFGACVAWFGSNLPPTLKARVIAVQGSIGVAFLLRRHHQWLVRKFGGPRIPAP
jgi:cytochrome c-type biogenesis protein CcmF